MAQCHAEFEHILKDACSTDNTCLIGSSTNPQLIVLSEPDAGIYDGMNIGFSHTTGDVVAFLNSDDYYPDPMVLHDVCEAFRQSGCDFVYGNIEIHNSQGKVVRRWITSDFGDGMLTGVQIPHPALFIKRSLLEKINGPFDTSYKIAGDLKQQLLLVNKLRAKGCYLDRTLAIMQSGGASDNSLLSRWNGWMESRRAYNEVMGSGGTGFVIRKVISNLRTLRL